MKKELPGGVRLSENQSRKLAYVGEFKEAPFLSSGALRRFLRLSQKITLGDKKKKFVDGDLKIVLQDRSDTFVRYLKVSYKSIRSVLKNYFKISVYKFFFLIPQSYLLA